MAAKKAKEARPSLDEVLAGFKKQYGENSVAVGEHVGSNLEYITTGIPSVDIKALKRPGLPRGRIVELYGKEASGKTTVALSTMASAQKLGHKVALVDAEHAFDYQYARTLGVNTDELLYISPDAGEDALEMTERIVSSGELAVVVVDSVSALVPRSELEGEMGDANVGKHARMMSQALRKLTPVVNQTNTLLIFINQIREKVGVMFGSPETTSGGRALPFFASVRMEGFKTLIKEGDKDVIGVESRLKVTKSKVGPAFGDAFYKNLYNGGIQREESLIEMAGEAGLLEVTKGWVKIDGKNRRPKELAKELRDNPDEYEALRKRVYDLVFDGVIAEGTELVDNSESDDETDED